MPLALALVSMLLSAEDPRLKAAIGQYESARFSDARDALIKVLALSGLSDQDDIDARTYLAACYLALKQPTTAEHTLRELAKDHPEAMPSPAAFAPDMIALADKIWAEEEKRKGPAVRTKPPIVQNPDPVPPPVVVTPPPPVSTVPSRALAFVPFGVGHFARGDYLQGAVWLAAQLGLFGASAITLVQLEDIKLKNENYVALRRGDIPAGREGAAQNLNAAYSATFFLGLTVLVANVIMAFVTWPTDDGS